ncbi:MAG: hypothetical protein WCT18_00370 [Patescibacteria group bacterium]
MKKIVWLLIALLLVGGVVYYKVYYPDSNWQLKNSLKFAEALPANTYFQSNETDCGIWYRRSFDGTEIFGKKNSQVQDCFLSAVEKCLPKKILLVDDESMTEQKIIKYGFIHILNKNDAGDCILQNSYEEQKIGEEQKVPISYINTCTKVNTALLKTCEPIFLEDLRKINEQQ